MNSAVRTALAATSLAIGLLAAGGALAATKSPAMQACSDQWAQLKADDKVPAGTTWPKFWSQCAKDYAAAHPDDSASAADKSAAAPAEPPPAKTKSSAAAKPATAKPATAKPASAKQAAASGQTAMQFCSDQWGKLKDAGKVPAGTTWPSYWSQCAKDFAAANGNAPATEAAAPAAKPAAKPAAAPASGQTAMDFCSDAWGKMKDAGKVPAGTTWPKFWSQCAKEYAAANAPDEDVGAPLPEPDVAAKINPDKPLAGKREPTPGQKAVWARMRSCGAEWQAEKKAGTLPAGAKWPQYWSDCNKRLKARGQ